MTDDEIVAGIIKDEGEKFTWDTAGDDPPTKYGITQDTLSEWRGHPCTVDDVRNLERPEAEAIYRHKYIAPCDTLPAPLRETIIHICVLRGARSGIMMLQGMFALTVDGWVGPEVLAAIKKLDTSLINTLMCGGMLQHFALQVKNFPKKKKYHVGWRDRFLRLADK
jgi:lysozyme family protein